MWVRELELLALTKPPGLLWQCVPKHSAGLGVAGAGADAAAHPECEAEVEVEFLPGDSKRILGPVWPEVPEGDVLSEVSVKAICRDRTIIQFIAL